MGTKDSPAGTSPRLQGMGGYADTTLMTMPNLRGSYVLRCYLETATGDLFDVVDIDAESFATWLPTWIAQPEVTRVRARVACLSSPVALTDVAAFCRIAVIDAVRDLGSDLAGYSIIDLCSDNLPEGMRVSTADIRCALVVAGVDSQVSPRLRASYSRRED